MAHGMSDQVIEEVLKGIMLLLAKNMPPEVRAKIHAAGSEDELLHHLRQHHAKQAAELSAPQQAVPSAQAVPAPVRRRLPNGKPDVFANASQEFRKLLLSGGGK